ncbi:MAG TPA: acyl-ACP--UDP-N-acetylglucosamine O-acyltransferase [Gammaproteobacteria bacterium]|nr:acyl-ACP--UDP-N-acetylglucosamine O-acyltransferase [Gammaproteobacteria bacterium]
MIDSHAIISPKAKLGKNVTVGPFSIISDDVEIGDNTWIGPHVLIKGPTKIGTGNKIFQFASVGEDSQDKKYAGEKTFLEIGNDNVIREGCTLNRGNAQFGGITKIGNDNLFMAYAHVAHDCEISNNIILANNVALAGHVKVEDYAILSAFSMVHQFCVIGAHSFIAAGTGASKDVLPYVLVSGTAHDSSVFGLNSVGLKRRGFSEETLLNLKRAYKIIFRQNLPVAEAIVQLEGMVSECPEVDLFITALKNSSRGITR